MVSKPTIGSPYRAFERMLTTSCRLPSSNMERKLLCREKSPLENSCAKTATGARRAED